MVDLDASTPQLKAVKDWVDAYCTLDMKNVEPRISKNFQFHTFPETTDIPKEAKGRHVERYREMLSAVSKLEVMYQEVIEAPGKVIFHATAALTTVSGVTLPYETVAIITLVEEDGELKVLHCKDFADPQKRSAFIAGAAKAAAQKVAA